MKAKKTKRKLKVYYAYHAANRHYKQYPVIRIGGSFLKEWGFKIGDEIEVINEAGQIVISKLPVKTNA